MRFGGSGDSIPAIDFASNSGDVSWSQCAAMLPVMMLIEVFVVVDWMVAED